MEFTLYILKFERLFAQEIHYIFGYGWKDGPTNISNLTRGGIWQPNRCPVQLRERREVRFLWNFCTAFLSTVAHVRLIPRVPWLTSSRLTPGSPPCLTLFDPLPSTSEQMEDTKTIPKEKKNRGNKMWLGLEKWTNVAMSDWEILSISY